ncbi:MAG: hypothetical protein AABZ36_08985, partial [Nitrospirota bacterium]
KVAIQRINASNSVASCRNYANYSDVSHSINLRISITKNITPVKIRLLQHANILQNVSMLWLALGALKEKYLQFSLHKIKRIR